jgi:transposase
MGIAYNQLPDDPQALKRLLAGRDELITKLTDEITRLRRWRFGRSAEKMDESAPKQQLALVNLPAAQSSAYTAPASVAQDAAMPASAPSTKPRRPARTFPEHLPRETIVHQPQSCDCPECGAAMRKLGEDISEMLDCVPGRFTVIRHVRPKLSCGKCSKVVQLPAPARPIDKGMPAAGLLAQVIVAKYADHCPLYRQQAIYRRSGIDLDRATLAAWVGQASDLLYPLVAALGRYVRSAEKLYTDDTPVPVLDPGRGKTKTGRLWTYVRDDRPASSREPPAVWYRYSPDRKAEHPQAHLRDYTGILQADGYSGFGPLYQQGRIVEAGCWAHSRRKFYDIHVANQSPVAAEAIRRIRLLYAIEREIRGWTAEKRAAARQARSAPVLDELQAWLTATLQAVSAKSNLAQAIRYTLVRWQALTRLCRDGRIELDNNTAERSIRAIVLGRRNYLFAGADAGEERAANIYSLIGTCLLNGIEPYAYLRYVLERIAEHPINRIDALLPWNVADQINSALPKAA